MLRKVKSLFGHRHPVRLGWHFAKAFLAALFYGFPARKLTVIGVTGTDGKTTTVGMIAHILYENGIAVGALSTAFFRIKDNVVWNTTEKTSPSPFVIQRFLRKLYDTGCTHAVLEYSSHGLVQGRTHYTWPTVAGITNTAMEHLDYHGSMEQYRTDKSLLFSMLGIGSTKVLNRDDDTFTAYEKIPTKLTTTYSVIEKAADLFASDISSEEKSTTATIHDGSEQSILTLPIPGTYNVENALCAIACSKAAGIALKDSVHALKNFENASGRLQRIDVGQNFSVFIDFTVTAQAFEKTLQTLRNIVGSEYRILVMTGSCGDRMREKRPIIGKTCSDLADVVVITDDEPYTEDPLQILEEVWAGVNQSSCDAHKIIDRREAMEKIFSLAQKGDAVVLCGLGSYPSRMMANGPVPWDEKGIAEELLRKLM
ncbi:MAG: UDP-N-acetylmuramyl-tripeptide synthetase [bacterium]|nr:UDP-N-acetylmuramyl-tripeptide synthetase [bacterium]